MFDGKSIEAAVDRVLESRKGNGLFGRGFDLYQDKSRVEAKRWATALVKDVLSALPTNSGNGNAGEFLCVDGPWAGTMQEYEGVERIWIKGRNGCYQFTRGEMEYYWEWLEGVK